MAVATRGDYCDAEEIGVALPRKLCIKVTDLEVHDVEGMGAVIPCRLYNESACSETAEEFGSGFQCRRFSLAVRQPATTWATMGVTMVAETVTLVTGVLLLVYDAVEGMQNR